MTEAVADLVRPGMHLHLGLGQARPNLAIRALLRQYSGERPRFTISATGMGGAQLGPFLITAGLVDRLETTFVGDQFPRPGPNRAANRALQELSVDVRSWSLQTMLQRIQAGANGLEWTTTKSLVGSSLADAGDDIRILDDVTLIRSLRPDLSFIQGIVADEDGNTVLSLPVGDGMAAAIAARGGAIVACERIVPREFIKGLVGYPILPGSFVKRVVAVRHGAHPSGIFAPAGLEEYSYAEDYEFMAEASAALNLPADERQAWIDERLLGGDLEDDYVAGIGSERFAKLDAWREWQTEVESGEGPATPEEVMATVGARLIGHQIAGEPPAYLLAGIGISCLSVWLARRMADEFPALISELGLYEYEPVEGNPFLFYFPNLATATTLVEPQVILGGMLRADPAGALAVVSAGQADRFGNLNTTRTSRGWISGSGGANDIVTASPTIALMLHRPGRLVDEVEYVTSPGANVVHLCTDRAVFSRRPGEDELILTGVVAGPDEELEDRVAAVAAETPWPIRRAPEIERHLPPSASELAIIRRFDPDGNVLGTDAT